MTFATVFAGILTGAPVAGFRPTRALRFTLVNFAMPGSMTESPLATEASTTSPRPANTVATCFFSTPVCSVIFSISCVRFIWSPLWVSV